MKNKKTNTRLKQKNVLAHSLSERQIFETFKTSKDGLTQTDVQKRLDKFGLNELDEQKKQNKLKLFFKQFCDLMIIILMIAALVSMVIALVQKEYADLIDVGIIILIVILNAIIGFIQEDKATNALEALKKSSEPYVKVIREGHITKVLKSHIVIGDIILLEAGDIACADIYLLESASIKCDESSLTGESDEIIKIAGEKLAENTPIADRKNMVFAQSVITYGRGVGVVVATGMNTEIGKIADILNVTKNELTPIQQKLSWLGKFITFGVLGIAAIIFVLNICFEPGHNIIKPLFVAIAIAVAAIPESLPAVITVTMAMGVSRMSKKNAVVKKLHAVETLGSCEIICSDKTGTLTQNKMQVEAVFVDGQFLEKDGMQKAKDYSDFVNCLELCNDSTIQSTQVFGDPTETALVEFCLKLGISKQNQETKFPRIAELPFDSNRKLMTTFNSVNGGIQIFTKGAPDVLLSRCSRILVDGTVQKLDEDKIKDISKVLNKMARKGLRVLAIATKEHKNQKYNLDDEQNLTFLGLVGMRDPPRPTSSEAVRICKSAGMRPIMITGDHAVTAKTIAKEIGIWSKGSIILTGKELDAMTDKQFEKVIEKVSVYARVSPENKVRIVETWKKLGKVVAMTGDGVNDAPSIKRADIGVGMGITGTEVTKNVADMVLLDDNFSTIIIAVKEGRRIYQNIQKVIKFLFGTNFVEVLSLLVVTLIYPGLTFLLPLQILFINLMTDSLPAIALSMEKSEQDIMNKKPRSKKENIFAGGMWQSMLCQVVVQTIVVVLTFVLTLNITSNATLASTMSFVVLSMSQLFHILNVKSSKSIFGKNMFSNWLVWLSIFVGIVLNVLVVAIPQIANVFGMTPLSGVEWLIAIALSLIIIPVMELYKLIVRAVETHSLKLKMEQEKENFEKQKRESAQQSVAKSNES